MVRIGRHVGVREEHLESCTPLPRVMQGVDERVLRAVYSIDREQRFRAIVDSGRESAPDGAECARLSTMRCDARRISIVAAGLSQNLLCVRRPSDRVPWPKASPLVASCPRCLNGIVTAIPAPGGFCLRTCQTPVHVPMESMSTLLWKPCPSSAGIIIGRNPCASSVRFTQSKNASTCGLLCVKRCSRLASPASFCSRMSCSMS